MGCLLLLVLWAPLFLPDYARAIDPDQYEPDDVFDQANVIVLNQGTPQTHNFHCEGDQDWVKFYGVSGRNYSIKVKNPGKRCDVVLEAYGTDGATLIAGPKDDRGPGENELLEWQCVTDGIYYVKVRQCYPGVYGDDTDYDLIAYNSEAPLTGQVVGVITDHISGLPVKDVSVVSDRNDSGLSFENGAYILILQPGVFTITAQTAGYSSTSFSVKVSEGGVANQDIEIVPLASVSLDIRANGENGPITVSSISPLSITLSIDCGSYAGQNADWWIVESTPSGSLNYLDLASVSMVQGFFPTYQGPLFGFGASPLLNLSNLEPGTHTFYFAVDLNMNGLLDMNCIYFDAVRVNVAEQ